MSTWRTILASVVAALISAPMLAYFTPYFIASTGPNVSAQLEFIEIPNPFDGLSSIDRRDITAILNQVSGPRAGTFWDRLGDQPLGITTITLKNRSSRRSGSIEISSPQAGVWYDVGDPTRKFIVASDLRVSVNPETTTKVLLLTKYAFLEPQLGPREPDLRILEDGKLVDAYVNRVDEVGDVFGFGRFVIRYPFLGNMLVLLGCVLAAFWPFILAYNWYINSSLDRRARLTPSSDLETMRKLIAHIDSKPVA